MIYTQPLDDVGRILTLAVRGERTPSEREEVARLVAHVRIDRVRSAARANQVEALVAVGLADAGVSTGGEWRELVSANEQRVEALVGAVAAVSVRLERAGIAAAAIEAGGILLGTELPQAAYCPGDIDLLVDAAGWDRVPALLAQEGFEPADRRGRPTRRIEFRRALPGGAAQWVEVGCQPFDRMWVPLAVLDRAQPALQRRIPSRKNASVHVLEPTDALALVALHTSLHSFVRAPGLRLHVDVDRIVRDAPVDWDRFDAEVRAGRFTRRAFVSLSMARGLLGTPVPGAVLERLYPGRPAWRAIERLLSGEGTVTDARPKLGRFAAVRLDRLLEERGTIKWLWNIAMPHADWMREHFDRERTGASTWRLHGRRARMVLTRWRPE